MRVLVTTLLAALLLPAGASVGASAGPSAGADGNDLREFRVGMSVSELPQHGYAAFHCAEDPARTLSGWNDWRSCPAGPAGLRTVGFRYENMLGDGRPGKTQVAGQPVTLGLLIDDRATVAGIRIDTDPHSPLYLHKKAFLFGLQARARYGADGWTCRSAPSTTDEQPIGGVFVHEHCEKTTSSRHLVVERELFHDPSKDLRDFTGATHFTIERPGLNLAGRE